MDNTIVLYYSRTGSNKYLAEKIANQLECDIEAIKPKINLFFFQMIASVKKKSLGIKKLKSNLNNYESVILCGPVWMGSLISPLRKFINKYGGLIQKLHFVSCCGSGEAVKDEKYGHGLVFKEIESLLGEKLVTC